MLGDGCCGYETSDVLEAKIYLYLGLQEPET